MSAASLQFGGQCVGANFEREPLAVRVRAANRRQLDGRLMASGTERKPFSSGALSSSELNRLMNTNIFRVLILDPLQFLAQIIALRCHRAKLRVQLGIVQLECRYLTFECRRLLQRKIQSRLVKIGDGELQEDGAKGIKGTHTSDSFQPKPEVKS